MSNTCVRRKLKGSRFWVQSVVKGGAFERLTDSQKYTGSHRARFDPEGKGKGIAGRKDLPDKSGYVAGYKNKDTYSKTH